MSWPPARQHQEDRRRCHACGWQPVVSMWLGGLSVGRSIDRACVALAADATTKTTKPRQIIGHDHVEPRNLKRPKDTQTLFFSFYVFCWVFGWDLGCAHASVFKPKLTCVPFYTIRFVSRESPVIALFLLRPPPAPPGPAAAAAREKGLHPSIKYTTTRPLRFSPLPDQPRNRSMGMTSATYRGPRQPLSPLLRLLALALSALLLAAAAAGAAHAGRRPLRVLSPLAPAFLRPCRLCLGSRPTASSIAIAEGRQRASPVAAIWASARGGEGGGGEGGDDKAPLQPLAVKVRKALSMDHGSEPAILAAVGHTPLRKLNHLPTKHSNPNDRGHPTGWKGASTSRRRSSLC